MIGLRIDLRKLYRHRKTHQNMYVSAFLLRRSSYKYSSHSK